MEIDREIIVLKDIDELSREVAGRFVRLASEAIKERRTFSVVLSGGSTPRKLYSLLAELPWRDQVQWEDVCFLWGDERCVPPDHPDSNYRMAYEVLLSRIPVPGANVHRMHGEEEPETAAHNYADSLKQFPHLEGWPRFDLVLLGMGEDGHTASLFPGTAAVENHDDTVVAHRVEKLGAYRLTLTPPVLNNAANVFFLVSGGEKAKVLKKVLEGDFMPSELPSQAIRPENGKLIWFVDGDAARRLRQARTAR